MAPVTLSANTDSTIDMVPAGPIVAFSFGEERTFRLTRYEKNEKVAVISQPQMGRRSFSPSTRTATETAGFRS